MTDWQSALSPFRPPVPTMAHWGAGTVSAAAALALAVYIIAERSLPDERPDEETPEPVIVALGAPAQRLEPPPPVETPQEPPAEPQTPTERAEDAPPPEPPPEPRPAIPQAPDTGRLSSGFGPGAGDAPPPPPPPPRPVVLDQDFITMSTLEYVRRVNYPYEALRRNLQGTGRLLVRVDRSGRVLDWRISSSAGHRILDREIERVARQVRQLDPLPPEYTRSTADLIIPFAFVMEPAQ